MWLTIRTGDTELERRELEPGAIVVGRDAACELVLDDNRASRRHTRLTLQADGTVTAEDLGSTNGTWVDGSRITGPTVVPPDGEIRVGRHYLGLRPSAEGEALVPALAPLTPLAPLAPLAPPPPLGAAVPPSVAPVVPPGGTVPPLTPVAGPSASPPPAGAPPVPGARPVPVGSPLPSARPALPPPGRPVGGPPPVGVPRPLAAPAGPPLPPPPGAPPGLAPPPGPSPFGYPATPPVGPPPGRARRDRRRWLLIGGGSGLAVVAVAVAVLLIVDPFASTPTYDPAQLSARWGPSTLYIQVSVNGTAVESGSGWVLNAQEGLVVTNAHVVDGGNSYQVGQGPTQQPATLVGVSPCDDLAVLKVQNTTGLRSFVLGSQATVKAGDTVTALGYPGNSAATPNLSVTTGDVSVPETQLQQPTLDTPQYPDLIQVSAPINPGNSGGPLLDDHGRVIGINSAGITEEGGRIIQGEGYAIGIDRAKPVLTMLAAGHSKGFAGFNFDFPTSKSSFRSLGLPVVPGGIIVASADPDSPAYAAGFGHNGPLILTAINHKALNGTLASYCQAVGNLTTAQTATFTVEEASGATVNVPLTFE